MLQNLHQIELEYMAMTKSLTYIHTLCDLQFNTGTMWDKIWMC